MTPRLLAQADSREAATMPAAPRSEPALALPVWMPAKTPSMEMRSSSNFGSAGYMSGANPARWAVSLPSLPVSPIRMSLSPTFCAGFLSGSAMVSTPTTAPAIAGTGPLIEVERQPPIIPMPRALQASIMPFMLNLLRSAMVTISHLPQVHMEPSPSYAQGPMAILVSAGGPATRLSAQKGLAPMMTTSRALPVIQVTAEPYGR